MMCFLSSMRLRQASGVPAIGLLPDLVLPDILVLGKALTGGYIGHAVTVANRKVYEGFYDNNPSHALMHGPTFWAMRWLAV